MQVVGGQMDVKSNIILYVHMSLWAKKTFAIHHLLVFEAAETQNILLNVQYVVNYH